MPAYSSVVDRAFVFAARAHNHQVRKGTDIPYLTHLAHVALILARYGFADEVVAAGLLHDVLEDTDCTADDIRREFGPWVLELVEFASEPDVAGPRADTWEVRKMGKLAHLEKAPPEALAVCAADRLHNAATILDELRAGVPVWNRFHRNREQSLWYMRAVCELLQRRLPHPITEEYASVLTQLEASVAG